MAKSSGIAGFIVGFIVSTALYILKIPVDLIFLIWQLLFAFSYWMDETEYVMLLQSYIVWLLLLIIATIIVYLRRRRK